MPIVSHERDLNQHSDHMDDEVLIGPFTLRQFVYLCGGFGLSYVLYRDVPEMISIPLIVVIGIATVAHVRRLTPPRLDEQTIRAKRYTFSNVEDYARWLNRKRAIIESQINERRRKGFVTDPTLGHVATILDTIIDEVKREHSGF